MTRLLIDNARIITPDTTLNSGWILSQDGIIWAIGTGEPPEADNVIDADGHTLLPGFIDLHVHGAVNADVMDANADALCRMAAFYASHGVTSFLPTTLTASHDDVMAALQTIKDVMQSDYEGARILGAHLEGPYLNVEKCGAQDVDHIRLANRDETDELLDLDVIRLVSLAPEFEKNLAFLDACQQRGITVSAAHTNASFEQMQRAIQRGITHSTHTYNAMPYLMSREPGGMAALWLADSVRCELIADTIHVHPVMMDILYRVKGAHRLMLITDAMRAAGFGDGAYKLGKYKVTVANGKATLDRTGSLAGSVLTMDVALRNFLQATGETLEKAWMVSSQNAAQSINAHRKGSIAVGKDADLVLVDDNIEVQATIISGRIVYERAIKG